MDVSTIIKPQIRSSLIPTGTETAADDLRSHRIGEFFKKTRYVPDWKLAGRDVAKDMREITGIPLLMTSENETAVMKYCQNVMRSADMPVAARGADAGGSWIPAASPAKFNDAGPLAHPSKPVRRATNLSALTISSQIDFSFAGAALPCGAPETHCHADV